LFLVRLVDPNLSLIRDLPRFVEDLRFFPIPRLSTCTKEKCTSDTPPTHVHHTTVKHTDYLWTTCHYSRLHSSTSLQPWIATTCQTLQLLTMIANIGPYSSIFYGVPLDDIKIVSADSVNLTSSRPQTNSYSSRPCCAQSINDTW
jgi:hypothetical protein